MKVVKTLLIGVGAGLARYRRVPGMAYILGLSQHMANATSLVRARYGKRDSKRTGSILQAACSCLF